MSNQTAWVQAGAGIVADSEPGAEYDETMSKAAAALTALWLASDVGDVDVVAEYAALRDAAGVVDGRHQMVIAEGRTRFAS